MEEKASNCVVQENFQHSSDTISRVFYKIFISLLYLYTEIVNPPIKDDALYAQITDNIKYISYFQHYLDVLYYDFGSKAGSYAWSCITFVRNEDYDYLFIITKTQRVLLVYLY